MTNPFTLPLSTSPAEIYADMVARTQQVLGDEEWQPHGITEHLYRVRASIAADEREAFITSFQAGIMAQQGNLLGIPQQSGLPAESAITVTAIDTAGHTLPAETRVWIGDIELQTTGDLVIDGGDSEGTVAVQCLVNGTAANGATGTPQIDPLDWIDSVVLDDPLSGGVDPETTDEYGVRLAEEAQLRSDAVALPADAAVIARRNQEVGWAYVIDHYDSTTDTSDLELTFSVVVAAEDGTAVASDVLTAVDDELQARREANYVIRVTNPTYTPIDVTCEIVPAAGWSDSAAIASAEEALTNAVSPDRYLAPQYNLQSNYVPPTRIYTTDLIAAARNADGVQHVIPSTFEIGDGSTDYIDLASPIDLPEPGTITVTVAS